MADQTPQLSAHDAAMVKVVDDLQASLASTQDAPDDLTKVSGGQQADTTSQATQRPADVPEQFWDAEKGQVNQEALLKAYQEATAGKQEPAKEPAPGDQKPADDAAAKAAEAAKLDMASLRSEVDTTGDLSPESYAKLEAAGFSKSDVATYIEGQKALVQAALNDAYTTAGGEDAYKAMAQWAAANASAEDLAAYDSAMTGNAAQRKQAIVALKAQWQAAVGQDPTLVKGNTAPTGDDKPYASRQEVVAAMQDPRYKADPAYRAAVARRVDAMDSF